MLWMNGCNAMLKWEKSRKSRKSTKVVYGPHRYLQNQRKLHTVVQGLTCNYSHACQPTTVYISPLTHLSRISQCSWTVLYTVVCLAGAVSNVTDSGLL